jgi:hypothetical protein
MSLITKNTSHIYYYTIEIVLITFNYTSIYKEVGEYQCPHTIRISLNFIMLASIFT